MYVAFSFKFLSESSHQKISVKAKTGTDLSENWRRRANKNRMEAIRKLSAKAGQPLTPEMKNRINLNRKKAVEIRDGKRRTQNNRLKAIELRRTKMEARLSERKFWGDEDEMEKVAIEGLEIYEMGISDGSPEWVNCTGLNPLDMPEILENIFEHLSIEDLLSCRDVNDNWKYEATKSLLSILRPLEEYDLYVTDPEDPDFGQRRV